MDTRGSEMGTGPSAATRRSIGTLPPRVHGGSSAARGRLRHAAVVLACLAGLLFASCAPPDRPPALGEALPEAVLSLLRPDTVRTVALHPGVRYRYLWSPAGPWAVHLVEAGLADRCELALEVFRPESREGGGTGRATVSSMAAGEADAVVAAVNADFFTPGGAPVGTEVVDGRVTARGVRPVFAWRAGAPPWMGVQPVDGRGVAPAWAGGRPGEPAEEVVGGFPDLLDDGARVGDLEVRARPSFAAARHPRTAVAYDEDAGRLWLVVVDGRQPPHSAGMSLPELTTLLEALGAEEALNLDGGGSTTMVVGDAPVNRPSDATGERPVVNALALIRSPDGCRQ